MVKFYGLYKNLIFYYCRTGYISSKISAHFFTRLLRIENNELYQENVYGGNYYTS
jgi:hypothetical protein